MTNVNRNTSRFSIGGTWVEPASTQVFTLVNPSTEEVIGTVPEGQNADIDRAVAAARKAFDGNGWRDLPASERAMALRRFGEALQRRKPELTQAVSRQNGMPCWLSDLFEGDVALSLLDYYAGLAEQQQMRETRPSQLGKQTLVDHVPVGVIAAIVPWNFPVILAMTKIAPALAAGCTMVIKPSPGTVLDSYILAEAAIEAELAKGCDEARLVTGGGRPKNTSRGWFVEPTVFADVDNKSVIAQEEIFGPVLAIIPYDDEAEAVRISNDSAFGLGGTVWSCDEVRALDVASRIQTGTIGINGYAPAVGSPFGGMKASGLGRELGPEALSGYWQLKSTYLM